MKSAALIETRGVPIDTELHARLLLHREPIQDGLIAALAAEYPIYAGRTFKADLWEAWLGQHGVLADWPRHDTGRLKLDKDTFKEMAQAYPEVAPIHELRATLSQLKKGGLAVGPDGRNRTLLSAFSTATGRCAPSSTRSIFGGPSFMRSLVKPAPGMAVAYLDFEQQEPAIAAAYSKDQKLAEAYLSGDLYLSMAKRFGLVPAGATKESHPRERDMFKVVVLATQYGMGAQTLARRLRCSIETAQKLLDQHRQSYPDYWKWSDAAVDKVALTGTISTVYGWNFTPGFDGFNSRAIRNFPMQAGGAEILRHACVLAHTRGVKICAPIHDAVLIESAVGEIDTAVAACREAMIEAGRKVLGGFELRVEAQVIRYPDRYVDKRGVAMWARVNDLLEKLENGASASITEVTEDGIERQESFSELGNPEQGSAGQSDV
jgi:hypothetical protein